MELIRDEHAPPADPHISAEDEEGTSEIEESEYPGPVRLTAILVSLVFSIFLVSPTCTQRPYC
jgi:hypothetical protein